MRVTDENRTGGGDYIGSMFGRYEPYLVLQLAL